MDRLTQTPLEKEVMIGMSKIDKIFLDCIAELDTLADTYKPKPEPKQCDADEFPRVVDMGNIRSRYGYDKLAAMQYSYIFIKSGLQGFLG